MKKKWYVVWVGRDTGIFDTWKEVQPLVKGFSGARHKSFEAEEDAILANLGNWEEHYGKKNRDSAIRQ